MCFFLFSIQSRALSGCFGKMDVVEPKRRTARKRLSNTTYPEEIVCQYSRFSHLLSHAASRKWILYEWQYNEIDDAFFHKCRTFETFLTAKFPHLKTRNLTRAEWCAVRKMILQRKCRRFSPEFIHEQRVELEKYRESYRILQENRRNDQLVKLNGSHAAVDRFIATLDSPQSQNYELFRLIVETKKLFAAKSGLIGKLREINTKRNEMQQLQERQQQQQIAIVNGNLQIEPSATMTSATALKLMTKMRDCNKEISDKLNRMMCLRIVKDTLLINAIKLKNMGMVFSPDFFQRVSAKQVHESRQFYRDQTFITIEDVQTLLDVLLAQLFLAVHLQLILKMNRSVEGFSGDVINDQMSVINTVLPNDLISDFQHICLPNFLRMLDTLSDLLF